MTHPTCPSEAPNSSWMLGTTTLTIELFKTETKTAEIKTANSSRVEPPDDAPFLPLLSGILIGRLSHGPERASGRLFVSQLRRHLDHEPPERLEPSGYPFVVDVSLVVEGFPGVRYRHGERCRHAAQGVNDVDHRVDGVDRRHASAGRCDESHYLVLQVGLLVPPHELREIQGVLGYARERPVVSGRAPQHRVRAAHGLHEPLRAIAKLLQRLARLIHRQAEFAQVQQLGGRPCFLRGRERLLQRAQADRTVSQCATYTDDVWPRLYRSHQIFLPKLVTENGLLNYRPPAPGSRVRLSWILPSSLRSRASSSGVMSARAFLCTASQRLSTGSRNSRPFPVRCTLVHRASRGSRHRSRNPAFSIRLSMLVIVGGSTPNRSASSDGVSPSCPQRCESTISCPTCSPISARAAPTAPRCALQTLARR